MSCTHTRTHHIHTSVIHTGLTYLRLSVLSFLLCCYSTFDPERSKVKGHTQIRKCLGTDVFFPECRASLDAVVSCWYANVCDVTRDV